MYAKALNVGIHLWHVKCMDMLSIISITITNKINKYKKADWVSWVFLKLQPLKIK